MVFQQIGGGFRSYRGGGYGGGEDNGVMLVSTEKFKKTFLIGAFKKSRKN